MLIVNRKLVVGCLKFRRYIVTALRDVERAVIIIACNIGDAKVFRYPGGSAENTSGGGEGEEQAGEAPHGLQQLSVRPLDVPPAF